MGDQRSPEPRVLPYDPAPPPAPAPPGRGGPQFIPRPPGTTLGPPPPWADRPPAPVDLALVRQAMTGRKGARAAVELPGVRASAVLCACYEHEGDTFVVLTRRSAGLRAHSGEVSFPGGGQDPGDADLVATALRETWEEVGIEPGLVEVLGELDHLTTVSSRAFIVPFVGILAARPETVHSPAEVDEVLHVSLSELLDPAIYREERWGLPAILNRPVWFFELEADTLWGATAAMLRQLLLLVTP